MTFYLNEKQTLKIKTLYTKHFVSFTLNQKLKINTQKKTLQVFLKIVGQYAIKVFI